MPTLREDGYVTLESRHWWDFGQALNRDTTGQAGGKGEAAEDRCPYIFQRSVEISLFLVYQ
jgi:hypothetical protein